MPLKIYCTSCSEPNEYTLTRPAFCSSCGSRFEGSIFIVSKKSNNKNEKTWRQPMAGALAVNDTYIEDNVENIDNIKDINLNSLQLEIPIDKQKEKGIKFEDLAKQQKTGFTRDKPKKVNKKKDFQAFLTEAANTKKSIEIADNGPE